MIAHYNPAQTAHNNTKEQGRSTLLNNTKKLV